MGWVRSVPSGRWQAVYRDSEGRQRSRTFSTKRDAREYLRDVDAATHHGEWVDPRGGRTRFSDLTERWWASRIVEATTAAANRSRLDVHVLPAFGARPVAAITYLDVAGWVARLSQSLAPETVTACYRLLALILDAAVRERLVVTNVAKGVPLPAIRRKRGWDWITPAHVAQAVAVHPPQYRPLPLLAAYAGLRWGEAAGLHVEHLDLLRRELTVQTVAVEISGHVTFRAYPKSDAGARTVPLPKVLVDELAAYLARHPAERGQPIFRNSQGTGMLRGAHGKAWRRSTVLPVRFHDLRHAYGSWLVAEGIPVPVVQELLGHARGSLLDRYVHVSPDAHARVRAVLDHLFAASADGLPMAAHNDLL